MSFTLGSDPEVLLVDKFGKLISSEKLIGGSKMVPRKTEHGWVQEDNVLVEFNTIPANSAVEFVTNTQNMIKDINEIIVPLDLSVRIESSGLFDPDQLQTRQATVAGCEPDYDAWALVDNQPPQLDATNLRTCGGHLHIAFDQAEEEEMNRPYLVRIMDLIAGIPSVIMDKDTQRRTLYGKAGAHRPKWADRGDQYDGVEYRTLSNFWVRSANHIKWAYGTVERAVGDFEQLRTIIDSEGDLIQRAINTSNLDIAHDLVDKYNLEVVNG